MMIMTTYVARAERVPGVQERSPNYPINARLSQPPWTPTIHCRVNILLFSWCSVIKFIWCPKLVTLMVFGKYVPSVFIAVDFAGQRQPGFTLGGVFLQMYSCTFCTLHCTLLYILQTLLMRVLIHTSVIHFALYILYIIHYTLSVCRETNGK